MGSGRSAGRAGRSGGRVCRTAVIRVSACACGSIGLPISSWW